MAGHERHCRHSYELYGEPAGDIHRWMDEPARIYGPGHKWTRHDIKIIPKGFIDKYGEELARQIMIDHILMDSGRFTRPRFRFQGDRAESMKNMVASYSLLAWAVMGLLTEGIPGRVYAWAIGSLLWFLIAGPILGKILDRVYRKTPNAMQVAYLKDHK